MTESKYFQSDDPLDEPLPRQKSSPWFLYLLIIVALVGLTVVAMRSGQRRPRGASHPAVGKTIERLQLEPLTGEATTLTLDSLPGKVTVVNFWGTWCPPCQEEFPHIVALWNEFKDNEQFQLAAVSCEPGVEKDIDRLRSETETFLKATKTIMPTHYDPQAATRVALMNAMGELVYPTTVVFDRAGIVRGYWLGYSPGTEEEIRALVKQLLAAK